MIYAATLTIKTTTAYLFRIIKYDEMEFIEILLTGCVSLVNECMYFLQSELIPNSCTAIFYIYYLSLWISAVHEICATPISYSKESF